ncbi:MAG TPA: GNAT family N-acetyltransferase [Panacibacter sp.]|nr:GNAT family N-acetyltransferase [Panacibacter sp.]
MFIRTADANDTDKLKELYSNTITSVNARDYNPEQIEAWASTANRTESLQRKINEQYFYVAETPDNKITGFASIDASGYLDMMYVHKDFQRMGIAKLLLNKILATAKDLNIQKIQSDVSITAKPFFEKYGFIVTQQQSVLINGIPLTNFKMQLITNK